MIDTTGMLTINSPKIGNEISDSLYLSAISNVSSRSATDNINDYQHMDGAYITGNVVRVSPINLPGFISETNFSTDDVSLQENLPTAPSLAPSILKRSGFKVPLLVHVNRWLQLGLIALCGLAVLAYSLDVIISHDVMLQQEQARRLSEQNAELSARLLKSISFQGIQESVLGQGMGPANLHVADEVLIAREVPPVEVLPFKSRKHHLPLLSGY